ncbi:hypothetical protein C2R22_05675 [Salinigranum rubrum]|uniref:Uncharacterized protein n=1 Tax=Salinigranum rubrum TaxID=755307 RepID=A0A2I8VH06_9EURY|nr:hypothetical protein [Salinigranum rubrum]AUV81212.1 hypothetical protein C2R22_05675 [Salinigranum rubrum]
MESPVAILPLDKASLVYQHPTDEIFLIHTDGEIVRILRKESGYHVQRRNEYSVSWSAGPWFERAGDALEAAADMQAFGFRRGGVPSNLLERSGMLETAPVEIEPLDLGGIIVDWSEQLPVTLHMTTGEYWRFRHEYDAEAYLLEHRADAADSWETIDQRHRDYATGDAAEMLAEHVGVELVAPPMSEKIREHLDGRELELAEIDNHKLDDAAMERFGMQGETLDF